MKALLALLRPSVAPYRPPPARLFCTCTPLYGAPGPSLSATPTVPPPPSKRRTPVITGGGLTLDPSNPPPLSKRKQKATRQTRGFRVPDPSVVANIELFAELKQEGVSAVIKRPSLINEDTARALVRAWGVHEMPDVTVIDAYAGPGGLVKAYLELPNVKRVIAIEDSYRYRSFLDRLKANEKDPERLQIRVDNPFSWDSYSSIEEEGLLDDVPKLPWTLLHPNLFLSCQLPHSRYGDQLLVQFCRVAEGRTNSWLFKWGRMRMGFLGPDKLWTKLLAAPGTAGFHKLAVTLPTVVTIEPLASPSFEPLGHHFHKSPSATPVRAVLVTPHEELQCANPDTLDYVGKAMFINKTKSWQKAVGGLAVGAVNLIPKMIAAGVPAGPTPVNKLELKHWIAIADAFDAWPFRPETLEDLDFQEYSV